MLFAVTYRTKEDISEAEQKRSLNLFVQWTPPQGFEFKSHYVTGSGRNIAIVEVSSAAVLLEAMAPWDPFFDFDSEPCVLVEEAVPIIQKAYAWRDSIK